MVTRPSGESLTLASLCPAKLLHEVREHLAPLAESRRQELVVRMDAPPQALMADPALLQQLLHQLVEHAIKSTREAGRILFSAITTREADESEWIEFTVRVSGTSREGGSESGLAEVQRIAALHAGRMRVESEPGRGSTFIVALPRSGPKRQ